MSSLKYLSNLPTYNRIGELNWDMDQPSDGWIQTGSIISQSDYPIAFQEIGLIDDLLDIWTSGISDAAATIYSLTYGDGLYVYGGSNGVLGTSTDGITWTARTSGVAEPINALTYGNGLYIYGGNNGVLGTSADGIIWETRTSGVTPAIYALIYGDGQYIFAAASSIRYSPGFSYNTETEFLLPTTVKISSASKNYIKVK